ncbi:phage holin family protein [Herbiconiux daphne]|uniref:Phage holin family protein n=1 Tax=Herbiconiux daphne TaxID=2970914 RepID=A0ABT2H977_9MICO|nr:phage holin family protein [Herbiconiux daphne]MCS5736483.1 phage holin family protein [Herbiconiux daphne]
MDSNFTHFWQFFMLYRDKLGYGILAATINALVHWKRHDSARDSVVDVVFCGAIGWGVDGLLRASGMAPEGAVMAACMIGYIGAQGVSDFLRNKLGLGGK